MSRHIPLTFAELKVGDHFVSFPHDGDNPRPHGNLGGSYLFEKTSDEDRISNTDLVNNAKRIEDGVATHNPPTMRVIRVL